MERCQPWTEGATACGALSGVDHLRQGQGQRLYQKIRQQRLAVPERLDIAKGKDEGKRRHRKPSLGPKVEKFVQGRRSGAENEAAIK
jgi:hypothetical protein